MRVQGRVWTRRIALASVVALAWLSLATPVLTNAVGLVFEKVYIVPEESSLWSFRPTEMNAGSGDWWIYGEDSAYYYHFEGSKDEAYHAFRKSDAVRCPEFEPRNYLTWCTHFVSNRKSDRITKYWRQ